MTLPESQFNSLVQSSETGLKSLLGRLMDPWTQWLRPLSIFLTLSVGNNLKTKYTWKMEMIYSVTLLLITAWLFMRKQSGTHKSWNTLQCPLL